jgi:hypothetical protein
MTPDDRPKNLCLNTIVKNETANLERCLGAVADHIACWVIGDTGSTDGTQELIESFFAARNLPGAALFPVQQFRAGTQCGTRMRLHFAVGLRPKRYG